MMTQVADKVLARTHIFKLSAGGVVVGSVVIDAVVSNSTGDVFITVLKTFVSPSESIDLNVL